MCQRLLFAFALAAVLASAAPLHAHDPGTSELEVALWPDRVEASWWIDSADALAGEPVDPGALRLAFDGALAPPALAEDRTTWDGHRELRFAWSGSPRETLRVTAALLPQLPLGHRVLARVVGADGLEGAPQLLSARSPSLLYRVAERSAGFVRQDRGDPGLPPAAGASPALTPEEHSPLRRGRAPGR